MLQILIPKSISANEKTIVTLNNDTITLTEDYVNNILIISNYSDTIIINNFTELIEHKKALSNKILIIKYKTRVGSGLKDYRILLLNSSYGKLIEKLHYTYYNQAIIDKTYLDNTSINEFYNYQAKLNLTEDLINSYIDIESKEKSTTTLSDNNSNSIKVILKFDKKMQIFYTDKVKMCGYYFMFDSIHNTTVKKEINQNSLELKLGDFSYIYYNSTWFKRHNEKMLIPLSIR